MARISYVAALLIACVQLAFGNDIRIKGEVKLSVLDDHTAIVKFPLAWDHSWRSQESWDAAYIFMKYKRKGVNEPWHHAYLKQHPANKQAGQVYSIGGGGNVPAMEFLPVVTKYTNYLRFDTIYVSPVEMGETNTIRYHVPADTCKNGTVVHYIDGKPHILREAYDVNLSPYQPTPNISVECVPGVFLFRRKPGSGNIDIPYVMMEWNFKEGDLSLFYDVTREDIKSGKIEVSVQAIEMVFVPNGPFFAGDQISDGSFISQTGGAAFMVETDGETKVYIKSATTSTPISQELPQLYPTGYTGFYMMKYEVSQEQYVNFLNRLTYDQQKKRINQPDGRGKKGLDGLEREDYVFGENSISPYNRNGIVLQERFQTNDTPVIFGFNLRYENPVNMGDDGKSLPCNFLTPDDVLAYCDWAGLRPQGELEYEKACRERTTVKRSYQRELAWGTPEFKTFGSSFYDELANGDAEEESVKFTSTDPTREGRVNGPKVGQGGPVRCGAFAEANTSRVEAGASRYGLMELTGNLSEIYYKAVGDATLLNGEAFGDGNILSSVATWRGDTVINMFADRQWVDAGPYCLVTSRTLPRLWAVNKKGNQITQVVRVARQGFCNSWSGCWIGGFDVDVRVPMPVNDWPRAKDNFILRGGSFDSDGYTGSSGSASADKMAVSYRGDATYDQTQSDYRKAYAGFRAGRSVPMKSVRVGHVIGQGQKDPDTVLICANQPYRIVQDEPGDDTRETSVYQWEVLNPGATEWVAVPNSDTLELTVAEDYVKERSTVYGTYKYRRKSIASHAESYGNEVTLVVPGCIINNGAANVVISSTQKMVTMTCELGATGDIEVDWQVDGSSAWTTIAGMSRTGVSGEQGLTVNRSDLSGIPSGDGGFGLLRVRVSMGGCDVEKIVECNVHPGTDDCPTDVTGRTGKKYRVITGADSRCWMAENSQEPTTIGGAAVTSGLYSWSETQNNKVCPEGFEMPTARAVENYFEEFEIYPTVGTDCYDRYHIWSSYSNVPDACREEEKMSSGLYNNGAYNLASELSLSFTDATTGWWVVKDSDNLGLYMVGEESAPGSGYDAWNTFFYIGKTNQSNSSWITTFKKYVRCYKKTTK